MSDISAILNKSVVAGDMAKSNGSSGILHFMLPGSSSPQGVLPPAPPDFWSVSRDHVLLGTMTAEAMWASAVSIACTKMSSAAWEIEGQVPGRVKAAQELLQMADLQRGWVTFLSKHLQDYLLTDNGAFIEIVRQSTSLNSKIIGLVHLDSTRCIRTGDPEIPVAYKDRSGRLHDLKRHEVIELADMPDSRELYFGVGHCAASRAYPQIVKMASIETYIYEKVTGRRIKEVHFVSGMNEKQVANFVAAAEGAADARGLVAYMGAVIVPVPGERSPEVSRVPLAEFPDGFNRKEEFDIAVLAYADAIGLDPQDLQPLTGRPLGTAAQSMVLSDKAQGKGLASWRSGFTHAMNLWVIPEMTTMAFIEKDWRDKQSQADYNATVEKYTAEAITAGILTAKQGLQALVDEQVYPDEFLPVDTTPDTDLTDTEKPENEQVLQVEASPLGPALPETPAPPVLPLVKEYADEQLEHVRQEYVRLVLEAAAAEEHAAIDEEEVEDANTD